MKYRLYYPLFLALILGAILRIGFGLWSYPERWIDTDAWGVLAQSLFEKGEISAPGYGRHVVVREPGWIILLAGGYLLGGLGFSGTLLAGILLGLGNIFLAWLLGKKYFSIAVGNIAAFLAACHPQSIYYAVNPFRENAYMFFVLAALWATLWAKEKTSWKRWAFAGSLHGYATLISTTYLLFPLLASFLLRYVCKVRVSLRNIFVFLLFWLVVYSPWPIRNYLHWKVFIPGSIYTLESIYHSYIVPIELRATPMESQILQNDPIESGLREYFLSDATKTHEVLKKAVFEKIKNDPWALLARMPRLALKLWKPTPYSHPKYNLEYSHIFWASALSDLWIIPLGFIAGLWLLWKPPKSKDGAKDLVLLGWTWIVLLTLMHAISFSMTRYRLAAMGIVFIFAAVGLAEITKFLSPRLNQAFKKLYKSS